MNSSITDICLKRKKVFSFPLKKDKCEKNMREREKYIKSGKVSKTA